MELETTYLGLQLRSPLVPSASPLGWLVSNLKRMEDAGAGAVVLPSLFEEQIEQEARTLGHFLSRGLDSYPEALTYLPEPGEFHLGPDDYLEHVRRVKAAVRIPVIASLNGSTEGGWIDYARLIQDAGADALEINLYAVPADLDLSPQQVEEQHVEIVRHARQGLRIPLAVKIGPYFTALGHTAARFSRAGAEGLVLFNRFYQPDFDLDAMEVVPRVRLSTPDELLLRLRWIAILYGQLPISLAATGGIHGGEDALKALLAGADVAMLCSVLLRRGIDHLQVVQEEMVHWMEEREYASVEQLKGSLSQRSCPDPTAFERASYMKALTGYHIPSERPGPRPS
ncbi:MAG TPA: dihydroorotate dehydrogenase-like protein [Candidatus Polarisedimenticolia bacterium]|jgi:dihydroorotate dehydrogenase (fumarate)|nr:dihydroorotate dehydrogenase-like protein [Candidatus Polarisedimenticolia bacterium]